MRAPGLLLTSLTMCLVRGLTGVPFADHAGGLNFHRRQDIGGAGVARSHREVKSARRTTLVRRLVHLTRNRQLVAADNSGGADVLRSKIRTPTRDGAAR